MERFKFNYHQLFLLTCLMQLSKAIIVSSFHVRDQCSNGSKCSGDLLFCSDSGSCQCNQTIAVLSYRLKSDNVTIEKQIDCELLEQCDLEDGCRTKGSTCVKDVDNYFGQCQCAPDFIRIKHSSRDGESCMKLLDLGEFCGNVSQLSVCNPSKNLQCTSGICDCEEGFLFDFKQDKCVDRSEYLDSHGSSSLGSYGHYCKKTKNCHEDMECLDMRCACPSNCTEELIKVPHICFCPSNYRLNVAKPNYGGFIVAVFAIIILCLLFRFIRKKYIENYEEEVRFRARRNGNNDEIFRSESHQRPNDSPAAAPRHQYYSNTQYTVTIISTYATPTRTTTHTYAPSGSSQYTVTPSTSSPLPSFRPSAPPMPEKVEDNPPTYAEAMQQQNTGATIETHYMGSK